MANKSKEHNLKNHKRQLAYLAIGKVMLPTLREEAFILTHGKKIKK